MMVLKNKTSRVIVFKVQGCGTLRLFPGMNSVDVENFGPYIENNAAAQGFMDSDIDIMDAEAISPEDQAKADAAMEKNDLLNKSGLAMGVVSRKLNKSEDTVKKQADQIKELQLALIDMH